MICSLVAESIVMFRRSPKHGLRAALTITLQQAATSETDHDPGHRHRPHRRVGGRARTRGPAAGAGRWRSNFLVEQGLAERRGQHVILARNLLATLRGREIDATAKTIAAETGLAYRTVADGERVTGTYRRNVQLASGRYAILDDGMGFSLVPWKPVIEQRLGQQVSATVRGGGVSWEIGRQRGPSVG